MNRLLMVIFLATALVSCDSHKVKPLIVGAHVWPGYEPLYLARELDYFDSNDVHMVETVSASQSMRELRNGAIDIAALTLDEAMTVLDKGTDVCLLLVTDYSQGADVILSRPEISSFAQLKGKRVAVEGSALGAFFLSRALSIHNMRSSDIQPVHVEVKDHKRAYLNNEVDAVVTFEPVKTSLMQAGARVVFSSKQTPGEIVDVLIARQEICDDETDKINRLRDAWFRALAYIQENRSHSIQIMNKRLRQDAANVDSVFAELYYPDRQANALLLGWQGDAPQLEKTARQLAEVMASEALTLQHVQVDALFR